MTQAVALRLANGLTVRLCHDAQATEAAALLQIACGSDSEPARWPGLAHLLEHLLFAGSQHYADQQRLMSWVPAQGGRLNATTRADRTACFFSLPSAALEAGLMRLVDMLAFPLLELTAIAQEIEVIDAEYRLLSKDAQTLRGAAQRHFFSGPPAMRRFHVGSRASFGAALAPLRQALTTFHQRHYHAAAMTLWLSGPQPLSTLEEIARRCGALLPARPADDVTPATPVCAAPLRTRGDAMVRAPGATQFSLTFALNQWQEPHVGYCALLRQLLLDEAEGGLLAHLRALDLCEAVSLQEVWRGEGAALIAVAFSLTQAHPPDAALLEGALRQWLTQLAAFSAGQCQHYLQLAQRQFASHNALDRLRELAFGFAPPAEIAAEEWQRWLQQLQQAEVSRLWLDNKVEGETFTAAGFTLSGAPLSLSAVASALSLRFWPFPPLTAPRDLPARAVPLRYLPAAEKAVLTLRPAPGKPLAEPLGYAVQMALRSLSASLAHQGGTLRVERQQGIWQIQLSGEPALMLAALPALITRLQTRLSQEMGERAWQRQLQQEQGEIPIRQLLSRLPRWLLAQQAAAATPDEVVWQAGLVGGDAALAAQLARLLSAMPGGIHPWRSEQPCYPLPAQHQRLTLKQGDNALLLFCPLAQPGLESELAWRLLALLYQPAFFQRLRVEKQVGYVVSCSFHQTADCAGILFALQSPQYDAAALLAHIDDFFIAMNEAIARLTPETLTEMRARLWSRLTPDGDALVRAQQRLTGVDLGSAAAYAQLTTLDAARLAGWHQALCNRAHWQQFAAAP